MRTPEQVEQLVRSAFAGQSGEFRPCAYFDDSLDSIRVVARDCSVTETRVNNLITVLESTYPRGRKCVGFTLKGATHFCREHGLSRGTPIKVSVLLDAILSACPDIIVETFVDHVARPLIREEGIEEVEVGGELAPTTQPA